jgi:hypothetical protein
MHRLIVGTGRCGSTLLDNMLAHHPDLLVMSEFFSACDRRQMFLPGEVSGEEFAEILLRPNPYTEMKGRDPADLTRRRNHAWQENGGIPGPMMVTMPTLGGDAAVEFTELLDFVRQRPIQGRGDHLVDSFNWLAQRHGRSAWVERSGASTEYIAELRRSFTEAKFVHIHRDGLEAALSMRAHPYFALFTSYFTDPPTIEEIELTLSGAAAAADDPFLRRIEHKPSVVDVGRYWTNQLMVGMRELRTLPATDYLEIRYEDLVAEPRAVLQEVAVFFDLNPEGEWLNEAAALVTDSPTRFDRLSAADQLALAQACHAGRVLLGQIEGGDLEDVWDAYRARMCATSEPVR